MKETPMRAVARFKPLPIAAEDALVDVELPKPEAAGRDLLVEVKAVSVNPVDTKVRVRAPEDGKPLVLGWDAAGVVAAAGEGVRWFKPGDAVFYAGTIQRPGTNAEFHLVDERIVGPKPKTLDFEAAAALPLTATTAWETLFDRLDVARPVPGASGAILIVGGAGGVGSIAVQLVRQLTGLTVIASASRAASRDWLHALGAHYVVDHSHPMAPQIAALGIGAPALAFSTTHTDAHLADIAELIAPQGRVALIDDPATLDVMLLKRKSVSLHWEFMFTRPLMETADMEAQHGILSEVSRLVDAGKLRTTLNEVLRPISAATLKEAHRRIEQGRQIGKLVVAGWPRS
jgi:NADPH:quinone reductase